MSLEDVGSGRTMRPALRSFINEWILVGLIMPLALSPYRLAQMLASRTDYLPLIQNIQAEIWNIAQVIGVMLIAYILLMRILIPIIANRYQITENRIVEIYGILKRDTNSTELSHIRRANAKIGVLARIMEICGFKPYGDLVCYTAGSGDEDLTLHGILEPGKVEERMRDLLRESQAAKEDAHTGGQDSPSSNLSSVAALATVNASLATEREYRKDLERRVAIIEHQLSTLLQNPPYQPIQTDCPTKTPKNPKAPQTSPALTDSTHDDYAAPTPKMFGEGQELEDLRPTTESFGLFVNDKQDQ